MTNSTGVPRRALLKGSVASLVGLAGCAGNMLSLDSASCQSEGPDQASDVTADQEPVRSWKWGDRIQGADPRYMPARVTLVNTGPSRQFTITARRNEPTDPELSKEIRLPDEEYVEFYLQEPDLWILHITSQGGLQARCEISQFDCNDRTFSIWVRCDGSVIKGGPRHW